MSLDPHDADSVREHKTRRRAKATQSQIDMQRVCSTDEGRRVMARILSLAPVESLSFVPGDPLSTAFNEGKRAVGIALHAAIINAGDDLRRAILAEKPEGDD